MVLVCIFYRYGLLFLYSFIPQWFVVGSDVDFDYYQTFVLLVQNAMFTIELIQPISLEIAYQGSMPSWRRC